MTDKPSAENLLAAGYKEYPPPLFEGYYRLFQKRVLDGEGTLYFVNFREWIRPDGSVAYDSYLSCSSSTGGTIWATMREDTISQTELLTASIWRSAGSVYYEKD